MSDSQCMIVDGLNPRGVCLKYKMHVNYNFSMIDLLTALRLIQSLIDR